MFGSVFIAGFKPSAVRSMHTNAPTVYRTSVMYKQLTSDKYFAITLARRCCAMTTSCVGRTTELMAYSSRFMRPTSNGSDNWSTMSCPHVHATTHPGLDTHHATNRYKHATQS